MERLVLAVNIKEAAPSRISNGKSKSKMAHKKGTVRKVVAKSMYSVLTPEYLARTLDIGLDKANQMLRVTTKHRISTTVNPIRRIYKAYHLDLCCKNISGRWHLQQSKSHNAEVHCIVQWDII